MDRNLALELVRVTEAAALAAARWMGKGDAVRADASAFESMRAALQSVNLQACIRVGRVALSGDDAFNDGMMLGQSNGQATLDLALDPLECIASVAKGRNNALSVVAVSEENSFLKVSDLYMEKIAVGQRLAGCIDLDSSVLDNLVSVASALRCYVEDLTVTILDRPRHEALIQQVREAGARIHLIEDGDLAAAISTTHAESGVDILMGTGSARAAVLAAAALACVGGDMRCRFVPMKPGDEERIAELTQGNPDRIFGIEDLVGRGSVMFAATGITEGDILKGVHFHKGGATTYSVVMRQRSGTVRRITAEHSFERKPQY